MLLDLLKKNHAEIYGESPEIIIFAPGRVNLIGEHTDYSEGYVMPVAINMGIYLAISRIPDSKVLSVYSLDYKKKMVSMYTDLVKSQENWFNYPLGVVKTLLKHNFDFPGVRITFTGTIPQGAGLSSSAALEVAVAFGISQLYNLSIPKVKIAQICRQAEHEIVGVNCGIMDQYISLLGEPNASLLIDCRSLEYRKVPLNLGSAQLVITNSNVPHKLSNSKYNERVQECQEAVKILKIAKPGEYLRDFSFDDYTEHKDSMPETIQKRAKHVITENARVLKAESALQTGNLTEFGRLMNESHLSLQQDFEVSSPELDWLTEAARSLKGCYGARLTGAGFGGCTVALMETSAIPQYKEKLKMYTEEFGYKSVVYEVDPEMGVHLIE